MQTITGKLAMAGQGYILSFVDFNVHERKGQLVGNVVASVTTDMDGAFSLSLMPGEYFLRYGTDSLPIRVTATSGTTSIENLAESL